METNLILLLIGFCVIFGIYILVNIFKRKISLQHSLMWFVFVILMVLSLAFPGITEGLSEFLGFEVESNMIFFFGFAILIVICFNMTKIISKEKEKVVILTQEIAILKHELSKKEK